MSCVKSAQGERAIAEIREKPSPALEVEISELKAKRRWVRLPMPKTPNGERIRQKSPKSAMHGQKQQGDARKQLNAERTEFKETKGTSPAQS